MTEYVDYEIEGILLDFVKILNVHGMVFFMEYDEDMIKITYQKRKG